MGLNPVLLSLELEVGLIIRFGWRNYQEEVCIPYLPFNQSQSLLALPERPFPPHSSAYMDGVLL